MSFKAKSTLLDNNGQAFLISENYSSELNFTLLEKQIQWRQNEIKIFGKTHLEPRLTAWFGPTYKYSSITWHASDIPDWLIPSFKQLSLDLAFDFNSVLINYYRNGNDSMGWHRDNEPEIDHSVIASLSFGGSRKFKIRNRNTKSTHDIILKNNDLLIMKNCQDDYEHSLPKSKTYFEPRINLTFRRIVKS